jgi:sulfur carrier protein
MGATIGCKAVPRRFAGIGGSHPVRAACYLCPMRLRINGQEARLEAGMNLDNLITFYKLKKDMVVIELNRAVPPKEAYGTTFLKEGDTVEIVKFLGGG